MDWMYFSAAPKLQVAFVRPAVDIEKLTVLTLGASEHSNRAVWVGTLLRSTVSGRVEDTLVADSAAGTVGKDRFSVFTAVGCAKAKMFGTYLALTFCLLIFCFFIRTFLFLTFPFTFALLRFSFAFNLSYFTFAFNLWSVGAIVMGALSFGVL